MELTLCQVRTATNAYLSTQDLPRTARQKRLEETASLITRQQQRNAKARRSHRKSTLKRLCMMGIDIHVLRRCKLE